MISARVVQRKRPSWAITASAFLLLCGIILAARASAGSTATVSPLWSASIQQVQFAQQTSSQSQATSTPEAQATSQPTASTSVMGTASTRLVRINQLSLAQYASAKEQDTWQMSACSTAALVEVFDAYGHNYKITNVLQTEYAIQAITVNDGLTYEGGIADTATRFGFQTSWGHKLSLSQVIATANGGSPVIVSFPPGASDLWPTGHILVVRGGNANTVYLADSSGLNKQSLSISTFQSYWRGFSAIVTPLPTSAYSVLGKPTISVSQINKILSHYNSPTAGMGQALYDLGIKYGIDPVYAMAFFMHESLFGTTGEARKTLALGNERCIQDRPCVDQDRGGYAQMNSWPDGFEHWYMLIQNLYIQQWGRVTVAQIIPKYAPSSDGNDEQEYIASIKHEVDGWRAGNIVV